MDKPEENLPMKEPAKSQSDLSNLEDKTQELRDAVNSTEEKLMDLLRTVKEKKYPIPEGKCETAEKMKPQNRIIEIQDDVSYTIQRLLSMNVVISDLKDILGQ